MKLKYEKPVIYVENFALCQNIALDCGSKPGEIENGVHVNYANGRHCGWYMEDYDLTLWMLSNGICTQDVEIDGEFGDVCYNGPSGEISAFGS